MPTAQNTFKDEDFLALANEELQLGLVPSVLQLHEDFFLWEIETPVVSGVSEYTITYRAIGNKLRNIFYKDMSGNLYELTRISEDDRSQYNGPYTTNYFHAFRVKNNKIILEPILTGPATGNLLFVFYIRANDLVMDDEVGDITNIDRTTGAISVSSLPKKFNVSTKYDFIQNNSPHVHVAIDVTAISINTVQKTVTFDPATIPSDLAVGDHLAFAQESKVPQVPTDLHVVLAHRLAARCLEAIGDTQGLNNANIKLQEFEAKLTNVVDNRVEDAPIKVKNRSNSLRAGLSSRRYIIRGR
jgi:hypothetical protein